MSNRRGLILWWNGSTGVAGCDGMHTPVPRKPRVMDLDIEQIDYMPGSIGPGTHWVVLVGESGRYMTDEEMAYVDAALQRMVYAGISEIC